MSGAWHQTCPASDRWLARVGPVDVPVASGGGAPRTVLARDEHETADHPLAAFVVAVEDVDGHLAARLDRLPRRRELRRGRIPERSLPEAGVAGRHVEIARQP